MSGGSLPGSVSRFRAFDGRGLRPRHSAGFAKLAGPVRRGCHPLSSRNLVATLPLRRLGRGFCTPSTESIHAERDTEHWARVRASASSLRHPSTYQCARCDEPPANNDRCPTWCPTTSGGFRACSALPPGQTPSRPRHQARTGWRF